MLTQQHGHQSDIFSLGATVYEICLLGRGGPRRPLPENGPEWQDIRGGKLRHMPDTPFEMQMIVREMMAPDPRGRPSAEALLRRRQLLSDSERQLIVERNKANAATTALDAQMVSRRYLISTVCGASQSCRNAHPYRIRS